MDKTNPLVGDLNSITENGIYEFIGTTQNKPSFDGGFVFHYNLPGQELIFQLAFNATGNIYTPGSIKIAYRWATDMAWAEL